MPRFCVTVLLHDYSRRVQVRQLIIGKRPHGAQRRPSNCGVACDWGYGEAKQQRDPVAAAQARATSVSTGTPNADKTSAKSPRGKPMIAE